MSRHCRAIRASALMCALLAGALTLGDGAETSKDTPRILQQAIGCLVAKDYIRDTLRDIGLQPDRMAWVRFHIGTIQGFKPTPDEIQIAVYARNSFRGWLLLAFREADGRVSPVQNAYQLTLHRGEWSADEGNGGIATYRAMSSFANELFKSPRYRIKLNPSQEQCAE
jgi:hypothetical protein